MKLSEHFTLAEATRSATAERRDIDNTPPDDIIPLARRSRREHPRAGS